MKWHIYEFLYCQQYNTFSKEGNDFTVYKGFIMSSIKNDSVKHVEYLSNFKYYVQSMDNREDVNFRDSTSFLCREEGYKTFIVEEALKELMFYSWKDSWSGTAHVRGYQMCKTYGYVMTELWDYLILNDNKQIIDKNT